MTIPEDHAQLLTDGAIRRGTLLRLTDALLAALLDDYAAAVRRLYAMGTDRRAWLQACADARGAWIALLARRAELGTVTVEVDQWSDK